MRSTSGLIFGSQCRDVSAAWPSASAPNNFSASDPAFWAALMAALTDSSFSSAPDRGVELRELALPDDKLPTSGAVFAVSAKRIGPLYPTLRFDRSADASTFRFRSHRQILDGTDQTALCLDIRRELLTTSHIRNSYKRQL